MQTTIPFLSLAIWTPILFGLVVLACGRVSNPMPTRAVSLVGAVLSFLLTLPLVIHFEKMPGPFKFEEQLEWIPFLNASYHLGVDGLSVWFIPLTALITIFVMVAAWEVITDQVAPYLASFLILSGLLIGVFASLDGLLFYVFFEATLIPMYIIIGVWGGDNRVYAAFKFFLYTLLGSLLTLVAIVYLYFKSGSFEIAAWHAQPIDLYAQICLFFAFLLAFAVKIPMWPVHTWLPDAHVEAPTGGSVVLAAIMLKLGAYGLMRFSLPILPDASKIFAPFMIFLSLVAVIYVGLVALVQKDMKKLVAYSSIAHMGFVTLGLFMFDSLGVEGAIVQMISHGLVSAAMFLCIGVLYDRMHSRQIVDYGGVVNTMPRFAALFLFFAMANCGLPATSGFVGEFMVILSAVKFNFWIGILSATTLILGAAYSLWMFKRVILGAVANDRVAKLKDLSMREFSMLGALALLVLAMGVYPKVITDFLHPSVQDLLRHVDVSKTHPKLEAMR